MAAEATAATSSAGAASDPVPLREHSQLADLEMDAPLNNDDTIVDLGSGKAGAPVTFRRTKGRDSLKRLSDILSAYIPVKSRDQHRQNEQHHQPLLEAEEVNSVPDSPNALKSSAAGYRTLMLLNVASLRDDEQFTSSSRENLLLDSAGDNVDQEQHRALVDGDIVGVAMSQSGLAYLIFKDSPDVLRLDTRARSTSADLAVAKACKVLNVRLQGGVKLLPTDIKVYKERLFVCGNLKRTIGEEVVALSTIARCNLDGIVEQASKELPQPRFLGFDIDPTDDQLVVASPMPDGHGSQIFKMSSDFKRKLFKIQLGTHGDSWHRPEFVACVSGEVPQCWVSAQQSSSPNGLATGQVKHRLLSFPMRPNPTAEADSGANSAESSSPQRTKDWMKISSWKFEGIQPGRLLALSTGASTSSSTDAAPEVAVDQSESDAAAPVSRPSRSSRLLMLSRDQGHICCIDETSGCYPLSHPASEGGQAFTAICSLNEPTASDSASGSSSVDILATTKDSLYLLQAF